MDVLKTVVKLNCSNCGCRFSLRPKPGRPLRSTLPCPRCRATVAVQWPWVFGDPSDPFSEPAPTAILMKAGSLPVYESVSSLDAQKSSPVFSKSSRLSKMAQKERSFADEPEEESSSGGFLTGASLLKGFKERARRVSFEVDVDEEDWNELGDGPRATSEAEGGRRSRYAPRPSTLLRRLDARLPERSGDENKKKVAPMNLSARWRPNDEAVQVEIPKQKSKGSSTKGILQRRWEEDASQLLDEMEITEHLKAPEISGVASSVQIPEEGEDPQEMATISLIKNGPKSASEGCSGSDIESESDSLDVSPPQKTLLSIPSPRKTPPSVLGTRKTPPQIFARMIPASSSEETVIRLPTPEVLKDTEPSPSPAILLQLSSLPDEIVLPAKDGITSWLAEDLTFGVSWSGEHISFSEMPVSFVELEEASFGAPLPPHEQVELGSSSLLENAALFDLSQVLSEQIRSAEFTLRGDEGSAFLKGAQFLNNSMSNLDPEILQLGVALLAPSFEEFSASDTFMSLPATMSSDFSEEKEESIEIEIDLEGFEAFDDGEATLVEFGVREEGSWNPTVVTPRFEIVDWPEETPRTPFNPSAVDEASMQALAVPQYESRVMRGRTITPSSTRLNASRFSSQRRRAPGFSSATILLEEKDGAQHFSEVSEDSEPAWAVGDFSSDALIEFPVQTVTPQLTRRMNGWLWAASFLLISSAGGYGAWQVNTQIQGIEVGEEIVSNVGTRPLEFQRGGAAMVAPVAQAYSSAKSTSTDTPSLDDLSLERKTENIESGKNIPTPNSVEEYVIQAKEMMGKGEFDGARMLLREGRRVFPRAAEIQQTLDLSIDQNPFFSPKVATLEKGPSLTEIKRLGGGSTITMKFKKDGKTFAAFKPLQKRRQSNYRSEIASWRLCELLECSFSVPYNRPVRLSKESFRELYSRKDSRQRSYAKNFKDLEWSKSDEGTFLYGTEKAWVKSFTQFPVEDVNTWKGWLRQKTSADVLDQPLSEALKPWRKSSATSRAFGAVMKEAGDLTTRALAQQLSEMFVFDYITGNWDRFSTVKAYWGVNCQFGEGRLISIDNGASFPGFASGLSMERRIKRVERFSRVQIEELRLLDKGQTLARLFPSPSRAEKKRFERFWKRRSKLLSKIDLLVDKYGEEAVMAFGPS